MAGEVDRVKAEVVDRATAPDFVERLGDRVAGGVSAAAVFGEPVEREGVTVIPVARSAFGFGGGSGEGAGEGEVAGQTGSGGGGGGVVRPIGFIEVRGTGAEFKPLRSGPPIPAIAAAAAIATLALTRLTRRH